jgi:hypothetical protein
MIFKCSVVITKQTLQSPQRKWHACFQSSTFQTFLERYGIPVLATNHERESKAGKRARVRWGLVHGLDLVLVNDDAALWIVAHI